jgi:molybdenum cofactor biosynthesis protein B
VVTDEITAIREAVLKAIRENDLQALLITGGTGITRKDVTIEAVKPLFAKEMTAFGAIFAQLSYEEIDAAAMLSRASAGVIGETVVFCMPGSKKACQLACKALIFPELGHVVAHV